MKKIMYLRLILLLSLNFYMGMNCFGADDGWFLDAVESLVLDDSAGAKILSLQKPCDLTPLEDDKAMLFGIDPDDFKHRREKRSRAITCVEDLVTVDPDEESGEKGKRPTQQKRSKVILKATVYNALPINQYKPFAYLTSNMTS